MAGLFYFVRKNLNQFERIRRKGDEHMFQEIKEVANRRKGHRKRGKK